MPGNSKHKSNKVICRISIHQYMRNGLKVDEIKVKTRRPKSLKSSGQRSNFPAELANMDNQQPSSLIPASSSNNERNRELNYEESSGNEMRASTSFANSPRNRNDEAVHKQSYEEDCGTGASFRNLSRERISVQDNMESLHEDVEASADFENSVRIMNGGLDYKESSKKYLRSSARLANLARKKRSELDHTEFRKDKNESNSPSSDKKNSRISSKKDPFSSRKRSNEVSVMKRAKRKKYSKEKSVMASKSIPKPGIKNFAQKSRSDPGVLKIIERQNNIPDKHSRIAKGDNQFASRNVIIHDKQTVNCQTVKNTLRRSQRIIGKCVKVLENRLALLKSDSFSMPSNSSSPSKPDSIAKKNGPITAFKNSKSRSIQIMSAANNEGLIKQMSQLKPCMNNNSREKEASKSTSYAENMEVTTVKEKGVVLNGPEDQSEVQKIVCETSSNESSGTFSQKSQNESGIKPKHITFNDDCVTQESSQMESSKDTDKHIINFDDKFEPRIALKDRVKDEIDKEFQNLSAAEKIRVDAEKGAKYACNWNTSVKLPLSVESLAILNPLIRAAKLKQTSANGISDSISNCRIEENCVTKSTSQSGDESKFCVNDSIKREACPESCSGFSQICEQGIKADNSYREYIREAPNFSGRKSAVQSHRNSRINTVSHKIKDKTRPDGICSKNGQISRKGFNTGFYHKKHMQFREWEDIHKK